MAKRVRSKEITYRPSQEKPMFGVERSDSLTEHARFILQAMRFINNQISPSKLL
jgi:hypothetical protein